MKNTTPPCPAWRELLSAYHDRQLTVAESRRVAEHLSGCAACRATREQWEMDRARFTAAYADSTGGEALRIKILEALSLNSQTTPQCTGFSWNLYWRWGLAGLAAVGVLITAYVMMPGTTPSSVPRPEIHMAQAPTTATGYGGSEDLPQSKSYYVPPQPVAKPMLPRPMMAAPEAKVMDATAQGVRAITPDEGAAVKSPVVGSNTLETSPSPNAQAPVLTTNSALSVAPQSAMDRDYGIPNGIKMAFTVEYTMEVKDALHAARSAQESIKKHGGFSVDFQYNNVKDTVPTASFHGKIPSGETENVLDEIEKLGTMRSVTIQGKDLTQQILQEQDTLKQQTGPAATETFRDLQQLALQHDLVDFTASFSEPQPRAPLTFDSVRATTLDVLGYAFQAFITLAMIALVLLLIASPWLIVRYVQRRQRPATIINVPGDEEVRAESVER